MTDTGIDN